MRLYEKAEAHCSSLWTLAQERLNNGDCGTLMDLALVCAVAESSARRKARCATRVSSRQLCADHNQTTEARFSLLRLWLLSKKRGRVWF